MMGRNAQARAEQVIDDQDEQDERAPSPQSLAMKAKRKAAKKILNSGNVCTLLEEMEEEFGTFIEGTELELVTRYQKAGKMWWKCQTLGCRACNLIITLHVPEKKLQDYELTHPSYNV